MEKITDKNVLEGYIEDTVRYAITVIRRRALPEVRDNCKPVVRRIIHVMSEGGYRSIKSKAKCARIVGDVMGKYHPHGDCLRGDTQILLNSGEIVTIEGLYNNSVPFVEILAINPFTDKVVPAYAHSFRIGQYSDKVYHISLSNGSKISCTSNHPILSANNEWIMAEELQIGQRLCTKNMSYPSGQPYIDGDLIQNIIFDHYFGKPASGYVRHHKDENCCNNSIANFQMLTRADHAIHHDDYKKGLDKGRETIWGIDREENLYAEEMNASEGANSLNNFEKAQIFNKLDRLMDVYKFIDYNLYASSSSDSRTISEEKFNLALSIYANERLFIVDIAVEEVDNEPMYDFTVDGYENMLIPMYSSNSTSVPFISVHNSSIYGAMPPLASWYNIKVPLLGGWGNFGTINGDGAAAMRYTESYLSQFTQDYVVGLFSETKNIVDWSPNFDNKEIEPDYLPVQVPLVLINGTSGIAYGIATNIPPHNFNEVIDTTINLIHNPDAEVILIPDHCQPCNIVDTNWKSICNNGNGKYRVRGITEITEYKKRPAIVIKSLPDKVSVNSVKEKILSLISSGDLTKIKDVINMSEKDQVKLIVSLDKDGDPYYIRDVLFTKTGLENGYPINFEVIDGIEPIRLSYKAYLEYFIEFAKTTIFRLYCTKMRKHATTYNQVDAYIKVISSGKIDDIYHKLRKSKSTREEIVNYLIDEIKLNPIQAKFILSRDLIQLLNSEVGKYVEEAKVLAEKMNECSEYIQNEDKISEKIVEVLLEAKAKYGKPRICKLIKTSDDSNIPKGTFKVVITENNYVRKIGENETIGAIKGDNPTHVKIGENNESVLLFDNKGKVFKLPIHKIPVTQRGYNGSDIRTLVKGLTADIANVVYEPDLQKAAKLRAKHFMTVVTAGNYVKKMDISDFLSVPPSGIIYSKVSPNDRVVSVEIVPNALDLIVYSGHKALRMPMKEIPHYKRNTIGVAAMNTKEAVEGLSVIYPDATHVVVITSKGRINKFLIDGLERCSRYKAGSSVIKLTKGDSIRSLYGVSDTDIITVKTKDEIKTIPVSDVPIGSSISTGSKMMALNGNHIIKVTVSKA